MKALKVIALVVLSFCLFMSLAAFGLAFTLNSTLLNKNFVPREVDRLEMGPLLSQTVERATTDLPPDVRDAVIRTAIKLEPQVKEQFRAANDKIYAYLLGRTASIDLGRVLKDTVLNKEFIASITSEPEVLTLARKSLRDELADLIPAGQTQLLTYLDQAMPSLDPWLKQQISLVSGPVVDYLVGDSQRLSLSISLSEMKTILRAAVRTAFMRSPPSQLAGATPAQLEAVFSQYYEVFAAQIPANATVDPETLGLSPTTSMAESLSDAESGLATARTWIGRFRLYYLLLIVAILVFALGIVLIHREVKGATRDLGVVLLTYGFLEFTGILLGGYILSNLDFSSTPAVLQAWLPGLYWDVFRPLVILSAVLAVVGLVMVIFSAVYRPRTSV